MKKIISLLACFYIITIFSAPEAKAQFIDLTDQHPNFTAIIYLQQIGVLQGYKDGTFRPDNTVNRAEFLKIILEGSKIPLDSNIILSFPDIENGAWYTPYLKKAVSQGWVQGYPDGTFKPAQTINKVEALKILGEVQNWELEERINEKPFEDTWKTAWYTPYVSYAKQNQFLEESGTYFYPDALMTRANISEIIYRTISIQTGEIDPKYDSEIIITTPPENYATLHQTTNYFDEITLFEEIPETFYTNEIFIIDGESTKDNESITIALQNIKTEEIKTFYGTTENKKFSIPVYFENQGSYYLGILPGESGQSKALPIKIESEIPTNNNTLQSENKIEYAMKFENDSSYISLTQTNEEQTFKKINFTQGIKTITYINRQNRTEIPINYKDFENFQQQPVTFYIEMAEIESIEPINFSSDFKTFESKTFNAVQHHYSSNNKNKITISPPEYIQASQTRISINGTNKTEIQKTAYVIKPDGQVDEIELSSSTPSQSYFGTEIIPAGSSITFNYLPTSNDTYIIEINDQEGIAVLNHPIYKTNTIPLIPDFFDLNERKFFTTTLNTPLLRNELLSLINNSRNEHGLNSLQISEELNELAQNHSNDMAENNYFSHINLLNQTPEDRRINAKIKTPVSENIAKDTGITFAHFGLMRSGSHRQNILNPEWQRIGIGIAEKNSYLIITEEFSTKELTNTDLNNFKNQLTLEINDKRSEKGLNQLNYNTDIENVSKYLNDKVIIDNEQINNDTFNEALALYSIQGKSQAVGRIYNIWNTILESIIQEEQTILVTDWTRMGTDIQLDEFGNINTIVVLNNQ